MPVLECGRYGVDPVSLTNCLDEAKLIYRAFHK